jgi:hypothetical protein
MLLLSILNADRTFRAGPGRALCQCPQMLGWSRDNDFAMTLLIEPKQLWRHECAAGVPLT